MSTPATIPTSLFQFAFCKYLNRTNPSLNKEFSDFINNELYPMIIPENWGTPNGGKQYPVLENYIHHTFQRIAYEYNEAISPFDKQKKVMTIGNNACFNTGLFTSGYEKIYAYFQKNNVPNKQPWYLIGFLRESDVRLSQFDPLPERARYFDDPGELIFDYRCPIRSNKQHILVDNRSRLPHEYQTDEKYETLVRQFDGAVAEIEKKLSANYKFAVPQYYQNKMQLLIPLCFTGNTPELALAIEKQGAVYIARTCLTLDMAYNNARLIVKPETDWLRAV